MGAKQAWKDRTALISGGSNGLGRALALALAKQAAHLIIVGRDPERLKSIQKQATQAGAASVHALSIDVFELSRSPSTAEQSDLESLRDLLAIQGCDLLINAVGKSDRGRLGQLTHEDLLNQFQINVLGTHAMTKFAWESLCRSRGVVVNISSLAGLVAGPGMGGYSTAKHALVGLHRQWRIESDGTGVHFLLVSPGPIARDDSNNRYADLVQTRGLDSSSQSPGGGVALDRIDATELSHRILQAAHQRELELTIPGKVRWLAMIASFWPSLADRIVRKKMKNA